MSAYDFPPIGDEPTYIELVLIELASEASEA